MPLSSRSNAIVQMSATASHPDADVGYQAVSVHQPPSVISTAAVATSVPNTTSLVASSVTVALVQFVFVSKQYVS